jgi:hypothetical protein
MDQSINHKHKLPNDTSLIQQTKTTVKKYEFKKCYICKEKSSILENCQVCYFCYYIYKEKNLKKKWK